MTRKVAGFAAVTAVIALAGVAGVLPQAKKAPPVVVGWLRVLNLHVDPRYRQRRGTGCREADRL